MTNKTALMGLAIWTTMAHAALNLGDYDRYKQFGASPETPICRALGSGDIATVLNLVAGGISPNTVCYGKANWGSEQPYGQLLLTNFVEHGQVEGAKSLLRLGADPNFVVKTYHRQMYHMFESPILAIARIGDRELTTLALANGANFDTEIRHDINYSGHSRRWVSPWKWVNQHRTEDENFSKVMQSLFQTEGVSSCYRHSTVSHTLTTELPFDEIPGTDCAVSVLSAALNDYIYGNLDTPPAWSANPNQHNKRWPTSLVTYLIENWDFQNDVDGKNRNATEAYCEVHSAYIRYQENSPHTQAVEGALIARGANPSWCHQSN